MHRATFTLACAVVLSTAFADKAHCAKRTRAQAALANAYEAYDAGDYKRALKLGKRLDRVRLFNRDYADYLVGQAAMLTGNYALARMRFDKVRKQRGSRFRTVATWRLADAYWHLGRTDVATRWYYRLLKSALQRPSRARVGDLAVARYRIAAGQARTGNTSKAARAFEQVLLHHPAHPLAARARIRLSALQPRISVLTARQRIARAKRLTDARRWREAVLELDRIASSELTVTTKRHRDYLLGRTLYKMRRQYELAGRLLLSVYENMGRDKTWALFHGARALSRANKDKQAIRWYRKLARLYPRSDWAPEAQYLSGWLHFNLREYKQAIAPLATMRKRYPRSKWAPWALWYQAMSHYFTGDYTAALPLFEQLSRRGDKRGDPLTGGKGRYWAARAKQRHGQPNAANTDYRALVERYPFSWYAQLSRARLAEFGIDIGPFGDTPRDPADAPALSVKPAPTLARDPLIQQVDELLRAGLTVEAGAKLRQRERTFIKRHGRTAGLAMILDRYRRAANFNRPWMIATVYGGKRALNAVPTGNAKLWWQHAYPLAYQDLVQKHQNMGTPPPYYLFGVLRKVSGFDPHTVSYANAIGLLQMIPPTTRRVAAHVDMTYTEDLLFDPTSNIAVGSWYIGRLFKKFKGQIPIAAASYNAGPSPVMRWLTANGDRDIDEYVELISFSQARGYGKKVTETYARYLYLYEGVDYRQPLTIDTRFIRDDITY